MSDPRTCPHEDKIPNEVKGASGNRHPQLEGSPQSLYKASRQLLAGPCLPRGLSPHVPPGDGSAGPSLGLGARVSYPLGELKCFITKTERL